jgi:hypothetical protein
MSSTDKQPIRGTARQTIRGTTRGSRIGTIRQASKVMIRQTSRNINTRARRGTIRQESRHKKSYRYLQSINGGTDGQIPEVPGYSKTDIRRYRYSLQTELAGDRKKEKHSRSVEVQSNRHCYNQTYKQRVSQTDEQCWFQMPKGNKN